MIRLLTLLLFLIATPGTVIASDSHGSVLGTIFDEIQAVESAEDVLQKAETLPPRERFQFLTDWVLPGQNHDALRLNFDLTPTDVPEGRLATGAMSNKGESRQRVGGRIVSPAAELMVVAAQTEQLGPVRKRIELAIEETVDQHVTKLAALVLVECAGTDKEQCNRRVVELYKLIRQHQEINRSWHGPILLAIQAGLQHEVTVAAARDLALTVLTTQIANVAPSNWLAFDRHVMRLADRASVLLSNSLVMTEAANESSKRILRDIRSPDSGLRQWHGTTLVNAFSRGSGRPGDIWHWDGETVRKGSGHRKEHLYFQSPLRGDYQVEFDASTTSWQDPNVTIGGHWTGVSARENFLYGTLRDVRYYRKQLLPPLTKFRGEMHYRATVQDNQVSFYANGRLLRTIALERDHDPWLAFGRLKKHGIRIWNVRITGNPVIAGEIRLSSSRELDGWVPYYAESIGGTPEDRRRWRQDDEATGHGIISSSRSSDQKPGTHKESLAYYHRPMLEDGSIEYQFRYEENLYHTHPALGRTVFLLRPDGVHIHQLTDGLFERRDIDPGNSVVEKEHRRGPAQIPMRAGEWNVLKLQVTGDTVDLYLNDEHIYQRPIESYNQRHFGLFHFSDQTRVYARNVIWRGKWPRKLPSVNEQELVGHDTDFLDQDLSRLTAKFTHTFKEAELPYEMFTTPFTRAGDVNPGPDGLVMQRASTSKSYLKSIVETQLAMGGDFDVRVSFDSLVMDTDRNGGTANVYLQVALDDENKTELNVRRRLYRSANSSEGKQMAYADYVDQLPEATRRDTIGYLPNAAASGTLRIARRGNVAYSLWAEADSDDFRIISTQKVPTDDSKVGGVRLRLLTFRNSSVKVRFKRLDVYAERLSVPATEGPPSPELVGELDARRSKLPAQRIFDFAKTPLPDDFRTLGNVAAWEANDGGLKLSHIGEENWQASSIRSLLAIAGDFDLTFQFDMTRIVNPDVGRHSWIYLKGYMNDKATHQPGIFFEETVDGARYVVARIGRRGADRRSRYKEIRRIKVDDSVSFRLARYGETAYFLTRPALDQPETLIARLPVPGDPVRLDTLWLFVHSAGVGRETHGLFRSLKISANEFAR